MAGLTIGRAPGDSAEGVAPDGRGFSGLAEGLPDYLAAVTDKERPSTGTMDAFFCRQAEGMGRAAALGNVDSNSQ